MPSVEEASHVFLKSKQGQLGYMIQSTLRIEKGLATLTQNQESLERIIEPNFYDLDLKVTEMQTAVDQKRSCGYAPQIQELINSKMGPCTYLLDKDHIAHPSRF